MRPRLSKCVSFLPKGRDPTDVEIPLGVLMRDTFSRLSSSSPVTAADKGLFGFFFLTKVVAADIYVGFVMMLTVNCTHCALVSYPRFLPRKAAFLSAKKAPFKVLFWCDDHGEKKETKEYEV